MLVNMNEAKTNFSKIIHSLETGVEKEVIICKRGKHVVRCVPISPLDGEKRPFGIYKDKYNTKPTSDFFELDEEILKEFNDNRYFD